MNELNILLADDDNDDCIFFKAAIDELLIPTHLTIVHDGEELMQYLLSNVETQSIAYLPHVLFLDLNMPRKNGFECLSEIKLSKRLNRLPVIIFSTSFEQEVVNQLYENGAQYFIRKPAEFSQYKKIIHQSLSLFIKKLPIGKEFLAVDLPDNEAGIEENNLQPTRENFVITVQNS